MVRLLGVLVMVGALYASLLVFSPEARSLGNQRDIANRLGYYGILTVGVGVLIVSGGIDLSIGSVVGLGAVMFGVLLGEGVPPVVAVLAVVVGGALIGVFHGLLVTWLKLQPFLVTLCGLFIYRGLARLASSSGVGLNVGQPELRAQDSWFYHWFYPWWAWFVRLLQQGCESLGLNFPVDVLKTWLVGRPLGVPQQLLLLIAISVVLGLFLHRTVYGRYLFAIGANEEAARYTGISTGRYKILAYVICSALAAFGGVLFLLEKGSATPASVGQMFELYAITGAVLGGCSLRGGEGSVAGMFLGAAVLPLLRLWVTFGNLSDELEFPVIGLALLLGTIMDEVLKRRTAGA
jgi:ribose transport system permease protein